jgi:hypothetical protein
LARRLLLLYLVESHRPSGLDHPCRPGLMTL